MPLLARVTLAFLVLLAVLVTDGATNARPAFADHECEVQGQVIPCTDPGVTPPDACLYLHYHGGLPNTVPDRNPQCGLGLVLRRFHDLVPPGLVGPWIGNTFPANGLVDVPTNPFRFADNAGSRPTITDPWTGVDDVGAFGVRFGTVPDFFAPPGGLPCNQPGGPTLFFCDPGTTLVRDGPYTFFVAKHDAPVRLNDFLDINISFPVLPAGGTGWPVQAPFVADTWQGASVVPQLVFDGGTGTVVLSTVRGNEFVAGPCTGCVGILEGPNVGLFVPNTLLVPSGNLGGMQWGYGLHVHDGTFGQCPSCRSTITAFPSVPRQASDLIDFDPLRMITVGATPTPPPASAPPVTPGVDKGGASTVDTDDGGGFPLGAAAGGALLIGLGGAAWYMTQRGKGGLLIAETPGGPIVGDGPTGLAPPPAGNPDASDPRDANPPGAFAGGPGGVPAGLPVAGPGSATDGSTVATSPTGTSGPTVQDPEIIEALRAAEAAGTLFGPSTTITTSATSTSDFEWNRALGVEERAQQEILSRFDTLLDRVNGAFEAYRVAVDKYRTAYSHALSGSTEMQGLLTTWAEAKQGAAKADLAFAVLTLAWGLGSLGLRIARWATTARRAAAAGETAVGGAEVATAGVRAAEPALGAGSRTARGDFAALYERLIDSGQSAVQMEKLAAEAGVSLAEWTARYGGDAMLAGEELLKFVARQRGWHGVSTPLENLIVRVLGNGRIAVGPMGQSATWTGAGLAADDVAQLTQLAQRPGFWEWLSKTAGFMEEVGWAGRMPQGWEHAALLWNADDIAFLKKVVEAGGDINRLRQLLGPAQAAAVAAAHGTSQVGLAAGAVGSVAGIEQATGRMQDPLMQVGDFSNFVDQFGVTDRFTGGQGWVRAGLGEIWELITAPVTTIESYSFTNEAQQAYDAFLQHHGGDLQTMGSALEDAINALEGVQSALDIVQPDDPRNPLGGGRAQALHDALDDLQRTFDSADPAWQTAHADELADRRAHIQAKLAYVGTVTNELQQLQQRIPQMHEWLNSLRRDPRGGLRSVTTLMNPEVAVRLLSNGLYLNGVASGLQSEALAGGETGEGTWDPSTFQDVEEPLEPPETDWDEVERRYQDTLEEGRRRSAELDQPAPEMEMPDFSDLPPADEAPPAPR